MQRRVCLHEILDIFLLRDRLFRLPRARVRVALFSVEIQIFLPVFLLADAADDVRLRPDEIGLHHIDRAGGIRLLKRPHIWHGDQILVPDLLRRGQAEAVINGADAAAELVFKIDRIVNHLEVRMILPRPQRQIVLLPRGLQRLIARLVSEVIGKLRALGARNQMQNRVVAREHFLLGFAEVRQNLPELLVRDIRLVVKQRPVVDDQHVFLRHHLRALQRQFFLMQLVCDHKILKIQHRHAVAERADAEAGNQLRRRLRNRNHLPAVVLLELLENAADERRFACGGSAGQNNSCDALCHAAGSSPSINKLPILYHL